MVEHWAGGGQSCVLQRGGEEYKGRGVIQIAIGYRAEAGVGRKEEGFCVGWL